VRGRLGWLETALFFALAGEAGGAPPPPGGPGDRPDLPGLWVVGPEGPRDEPEAAWSDAASDFDGTPVARSPDRAGPRAKSGRSSASGAPGAASGRDFALGPMGVFGLLLLAWAGVFEGSRWRDIGAAILVIGMLLLAVLPV